VTTRPFEDVVTEHGLVVLRVCRALLGPHDAEDAWSATFLSALEAYPRLRPDSDVKAWLVTIAHNKAIDQLRVSGRTRPSAELPERAAPDHHAVDTEGELRAALDRLPPKQRGAVIFRYLADLAYVDVAALLECSEAAARRSAADGIAALRQVHQEGSS
jgi:RNA polymerase sigma factor (sigma-70 family)